ncbi:MAG: SUMF1/EgtB/PvdO family nonheme iron enzyme [Phycisphaerales bacterium]|jgi:formylglycine-generating enzyme required for sulfatase activity|nr:SUMF1/EgtB/PvdO family nonheme iron enzyme [Phycisphaerales bacterium]
MTVKILTVGILMLMLVSVSVSIGVTPSIVDVKTLKSKDYTVPCIKMKMKLIPAGSFTMGSAKSEPYRRADEVQHKVTISKPFYMGACEVTQKQYYDIMLPGFDHESWQYVRGPIHAGTAFFYRARKARYVYEGGKLNLQHPMECVTWEKAREFCRKITELERKAKRLPKGYVYRLPTEAEWEYACRAGAKGPYNVASDGKTAQQLKDPKYIKTFANVGEGKPIDVGQKKPNAWGLYDMHGNVYEWCLDWYAPYPNRDDKDPVGPPKGTQRVARGGCFNGTAPLAPPGVIARADSFSSIGPFMRSASRGRFAPDVNFYAIIGFRVVLAPKTSTQK